MMMTRSKGRLLSGACKSAKAKHKVPSWIRILSSLQRGLLPLQAVMKSRRRASSLTLQTASFHSPPTTEQRSGGHWSALLVTWSSESMWLIMEYDVHSTIVRVSFIGNPPLDYGLIARHAECITSEIDHNLGNKVD